MTVIQTLTSDRPTVIEVIGAGPQGPPGTGSGSGGIRLLYGTAEPLSGSGFDPLDGVNDPWRWTPIWGGWVGQPVVVSWNEGDIIPAFATLPEGEVFYLILAPGQPTFIEADSSDFAVVAQTFSEEEGWLDAGAASGILQSVPPELVTVRRFRVTTPTGTGIAFIIQNELGYTGPTTVPNPTLDVADLLGDVAVTGPYDFPETAGDGEDGDFYLRFYTNPQTGWPETALYGPKAGVWPAPRIITGFDATAFHRLSNSLYLARNDSDPLSALLTIQTTDETPDNYLSPGDVAMWYDATEGAAAVRFKGIDEAGNVVRGAMPLT